MANDRDERLRRAEKAVRQGRIDLAIAEYTALVSEQVTDLSSMNALGDLLVRAGRSPEAIPFYLRVADAYLQEGFYSKAAGFYRKVLKFAPQDEMPALRLGEALAAQGLLVEAKAQFKALLQARRKRGDAAGVEQLVVRLAELDPNDAPARLEAARILVAAGDPRGFEWLDLLAAQLEERGNQADALQVLTEIVHAVPGDVARRAQLVRALLDAGDCETARPLLSPDVVGQDRVLLQQSTELALRAGSADDVRRTLEAWLVADPAARHGAAALAASLSGLDSTRGFLAVEVVVDWLVAQGDYEGAAGQLREYVGAHPGAVAALLRLIDVCIDGSLGAWLGPAQAELAEAYRAGGALREARLVAEDLLLREPQDPAHRELLQRVLLELGEADPDKSIDALFALGSAEPDPAITAFESATIEDVPVDLAIEEVAVAPVPVLVSPAVPVEVVAPVTVEVSAELDAGTAVQVDAEPWFVQIEETDEPEVPTVPGPAPGTVELDLTDAMNAIADPDPERLEPVLDEDGDWDDLESGEDGEGDEEGEEDEEDDEAVDGVADAPIESVFDDLRARASTTRGVDGRQQLALGRTYLAAGLLDQAMSAFTRAAHDASVRAVACTALGELFEEQQDYGHAIEWFERGADAAHANDDERLEAMRRLATVLESANESVRALAVWLEIQTLHPEDREAPVRVARLSGPGR